MIGAVGCARAITVEPNAWSFQSCSAEGGIMNVFVAVIVVAIVILVAFTTTKSRPKAEDYHQCPCPVALLSHLLLWPVRQAGSLAQGG